MKKFLNWILKRVGIKKSIPTITPRFNKSASISNIQIGELTDEEMKRFNLGSYSKKSTPGSISL
jgi:hypothetical protein